jgi:hypothetical protein
MPTEPTAEELLELLAAIRDTLAIEPPSTSEEDPSRRALAALEHRKLAEHRALLVLVALENFQRDPGTHPATRTAAWLREQAARPAATSHPQQGPRRAVAG